MLIKKKKIIKKEMEFIPNIEFPVETPIYMIKNRKTKLKRKRYDSQESK